MLAASLAYHLPRLDPPLRQVSRRCRRCWRTRSRRCAGRRSRPTRIASTRSFCAYIAAHLWRWGVERNRHLGSGETGSIVLPALRGDIDRSRGA